MLNRFLILLIGIASLSMQSYAQSGLENKDVNTFLIDYYIHNNIDSIDVDLENNSFVISKIGSSVAVEFSGQKLTYLLVSINNVTELFITPNIAISLGVNNGVDIRYGARHEYYLGVNRVVDYLFLDKSLNIIGKAEVNKVKTVNPKLYDGMRKWDETNDFQLFSIEYKKNEIKDVQLCKKWLESIYAKAYKYQAKALFGNRKFEESNLNYEKALQFNSKDYNVLFNIGNNHSYSGEYKKAMKYYDQVIEGNYKPLLVMSYFNRGVSYFYNNKYKKAIKEFNKTIELDKNYTQAYYIRGWTYSLTKRMKEGAKDFTKAIQLNPKHGDAYFRRGLARFLSGDEEGYHKDLYLARLYKSNAAITYIKSSNVELPNSLFTSDAEFIYGEMELDSFITENLVRPKDCIEGKFEFDIYFRFTVGFDGNVTNVVVNTVKSLSIKDDGHSEWAKKMLDSIRPILKSEIERVMIFSSGLWIPKVDGDKRTWQIVERKYELRIPEHYSKAGFKEFGWDAFSMPYYLQLDVDENSSPKYYNMGVKKVSQKRYLLAIKYFMRAVMLDNTNSDAFYNLGVAYYLNAEKRKACQTWKKAASMKDEEAELMLENNCKF